MRVSYSNPFSNLKTHRDGTTTKGRSQTGCPGRDRAIKSGIEVPLSVAEVAASKNKVGGSMAEFVSSGPRPKFDNLTFNQIMMIWLVRTALPWKCIEDPWLRVGIRYLNGDAKLFGRSWAAKEAARLNISMKKIVFHKLSVGFQISVSYLTLTNAQIFLPIL